MGLVVTFCWIISEITVLSGTTRLEEAQDTGIICVNDYSQTISCVLNRVTGPCHTESTDCWLEFDSGVSIFNCSLMNIGNRYSCKAYGDDYSFDDFSELIITLCTRRNGQESRTVMISNYSSMYHIKPVTPRNLTVYWHSGKYHFTWECGYDKIDCRDLCYELSIYKSGLRNQTKILNPESNTYYIKDDNIEANVTYFAKVRSHPKVPYTGQWSEWSKTVRWTTRNEQVPLPFEKLNILLYMVAAVFVFLFFSFTARQKLKASSKIPTPAPYFQSLYNVYKGNFQSWLVYPSYMEDLCKMDELLKIDTLIEARPISNEESCHTPAFHFAPYQAPYVHKNRKEWTMHDQDDSSCSPQPLLVQKNNIKEMLNNQSQDLNNSDCKDVITSLDSNEPQDVPTKEQESPVYHDDYCTLADVPNGLVPTAMVKKSFEGSLDSDYSKNTEMGFSAKG